MQDIKIGRTNT